MGRRLWTPSAPPRRWKQNAIVIRATLRSSAKAVSLVTLQLPLFPMSVFAIDERSRRAPPTSRSAATETRKLRREDDSPEYPITRFMITWMGSHRTGNTSGTSSMRNNYAALFYLSGRGWPGHRRHNKQPSARSLG